MYTAGVGALVHTSLAHIEGSSRAACRLWPRDRILLPAYINSLAAVLNAHADNELREKEFLKNTISDISHQLKTPLAALNIYNGLLQDEDIEVSSVKEFAGLSEQELDRIETLVQSLLKITRLDAGAIVLEKNAENVADMMRDME